MEFHARLLGFNQNDWMNSTEARDEIRKLVSKSLRRTTLVQLYGEHKPLKAHVDRLHDNSRGSGLLANARAERTKMLNTQVLGSHFTWTSRAAFVRKKLKDHVVLRWETSVV